jgi:hypothetical protein
VTLWLGLMAKKKQSPHSAILINTFFTRRLFGLTSML